MNPRLSALLASAISLALLMSPAGSAAQDGASWNSPRALELITRARERRARPLADSLLRNYRATAAGMVYFYLDRRDSDERTLVKSDQIALEVYWAAPDRTKQRIVGMHGENSLPNRMYYHLDHLTVVQNEFADVIRLGDGDEVRDVIHPAAPGADSIYDYNLSDSLTIRLPGAPEPVRAYQLDVRPRQSDRSAFVGSVFVDRATADIVRMTFTFTPASYVDRRLDYINISLDNSLWDGRYWLPYEQAVEIRRQIPELDFVAGAVIQGRFRVADYEFNQDLPAGTFAGNPVSAAPRAQRESFPFTQELYDDLVETGLAPPPHMRDIRAQAATLLRKRALSGLPPLRFNLPNASSLFRYDRAEGVVLGAGLSWVPGSRFRAELTGGYRVAARRGHGNLGLRLDPAADTRVRASLYYDALRDLDVRPGLPLALNTLSALSFGDDFLDAFYARGASISIVRNFSPLWSAGLDFNAERHRAAQLTAETVVFGDVADFRPVLPVDEGDLFAATAKLARSMPEYGDGEWSGALSLQAGTFSSDFFARPTAEFSYRRQSSDLRRAALFRASAGLAVGSPASQQLFLIGGRETVPGYAYRSYLGDAYAIADLEFNREIATPWLGLRLLAAAGWAGWLDGAPSTSPTSPAVFTTWSARPTRGIQTSLGAGFSFFYDIGRLDLVRGLSDGGEWQLLFSVTPRFRGFL